MQVKERQFMSNGQYISVRETAQILGVSEKNVMDFIEDKSLNAYRIANQFLRLKKSEVLALQSTGSVENETTEHFYTLNEKIQDFFYFNDFYLVSSLIVVSLLFIIIVS